MTKAELMGGARDGLVLRMETLPTTLGLPVDHDDAVQWYDFSHVRADGVRIYRAAGQAPRHLDIRI
jgi:hypothetical protein